MKDGSIFAFPFIDEYNNIQAHGMTLRDWFASQSPFNADHAIELITGAKNGSTSIDKVSKALAEINYRYADAMIIERGKNK